MRTLAALLFIAGAAALAVVLVRTPTVADGRAMAAGLIENVRKDGVVRLECDEKIPIGVRGATFRCVATLTGGATQAVDYMLKPDGQYELRPHAVEPARNSAPRDPWAK